MPTHRVGMIVPRSHTTHALVGARLDLSNPV
jgi:hypothetical protein